MPLMRVEVKNEYGLGAPEMYTEVNNDEPKEIFEGIAVAGLVGVLRQLGDLADFAAKVFHCLQEEVMGTCSRSCKLMGRIQRIEVALVPVEKAVLAQQSHLHLAYTAGVNWHAPSRCEENHFVYSDMPEFVLDSYEDCRSPPHFHLLDRFDPGGPGSCLKRYSDPTSLSNAPEANSDARTRKVRRDVKRQQSKTPNVQISLTQEQGFCNSYSDTWGGKTPVVEPAMEDYGNDISLKSFLTMLDLENLGTIIEEESETNMNCMRKPDVSEGGSSPSSPPLAHMKISGHPMDGLKTSKMKLRCMDGDIIDRNCIIDIFPSFQLVPEVSNMRLNVSSVTDDDSTCRSIPYLPDDLVDHQSESYSRQWEPSRPHGSEDPGFFDSLCRISLAESIENKRMTCLEEPEFATAAPPPLPPVQWWAVKPHPDTTEISKPLNSPSDPKHSSSSSPQQHKPAPINHDENLETSKEQKSKQFSSEMSNSQREANLGKSIDENNFLNQIRRRSLSLRPTVPAKPIVPLRSSTNIQVMTILDKANAIRKAVGSDDGDN